MLGQYFSKLLQINFSLKTNILANFIGNAVMTAASIIFVPIYLRYIGVESYGLFGFFASFQAVLVVMDLGLNFTLTRELALRDGIEEKAQESRNLVRTLEIIYWGIALSLGVLSILLVPILTDWVNPTYLSSETVKSSLNILCIALILQFPITFYIGGLMGLQKQFLSSIINIFFAFFRYVGAWGVLIFISSKPQAFFIWQVISSGFQVLTLWICLWLILPRGREKTRFQKNLLVDIWELITGIGKIWILSVLLMQIDKIILAKILSLEHFGYYTIASLVATSLYRIIYPIFQAYFPMLSQLAGQSQEELIAKTYHQGCQVMSVIILPIAAMFIFFPKEIVFLWQQNAEIANQTSLLISLLTIGFAINSFIFIPQALQMANNWTKLYFYFLLFAFILAIPSMIFLSLRFGEIGVAIVFIIIFASFILFLIPLMHRKLLPKEKWKWYSEDVGLPTFAAISVGALSRYIFVSETSQIIMIFQLGFLFTAIFLATCLITPYTRNWVASRLFSLNLISKDLQ